MTVSNGKLTEAGYLTRESHKVVGEVGNLSIEDLTALWSWDTGVGLTTTYTIPQPTYMAHLHVAGRPSQSARQSTIDLLDEIDQVDQLIASLIQHWAPMRGVVPALKVIPLREYSIYERGVKVHEAKTKDAATGGAFTMVTQSPVEAFEVTHQRMQAAVHVLARFLPGKEVSPVHFVTLPNQSYPDIAPAKAKDVHATRPMEVMQGIIDQIATTLEEKSLKERIQTELANLLATWHAWKFYTDQYKSGQVLLNEWHMKMFLEFLSELSKVLDYKAVFPVNSKVHTRDFSVLAANFRAVKLLEPVFREAIDFQWMPLASMLRVESSMNYFTISGSPLVERVNYAEAKTRLNLSGWPVPMMIPMGIVDDLDPKENPDFSTSPVVSSFYRSTRDPTQLVGVRNVVMDFSQVKDTQHVNKAYNDMVALITDRLTPRSFFATKPGAKDSERQAAYEKSPVGAATKILKDIGLTEALGFQDAIPISGTILKNGGQIECANVVPGYSMDIVSDEDTVVSSTVAFPWWDDMQRSIHYKLQSVPFTAPTPWIAR